MTQLYTTGYVLLPRTVRGVEALDADDDDSEVERNGRT